MKIPDKFWNVLQGTAKGTGSAGSKISVATSKGIIGGCYCGGQIVAGQKVFLAKAQNNQWWVFSSVPTTNQVVRNTKQIFKGKAPVTKIIENLVLFNFKTIAYAFTGSLLRIIKSGDIKQIFDKSSNTDLTQLYLINTGKNPEDFKIVLCLYEGNIIGNKYYVYQGNNTSSFQVVFPNDTSKLIGRWLGYDIYYPTYYWISTTGGSSSTSTPIQINNFNFVWYYFSTNLKTSTLNRCYPPFYLTTTTNNYTYSKSDSFSTYQRAYMLNDTFNAVDTYNAQDDSYSSGLGTFVAGSNSYNWNLDYYGGTIAITASRNASSGSSSIQCSSYIDRLLSVYLFPVDFPYFLCQVIVVNQGNHSAGVNNILYKTVIDANKRVEYLNADLNITASFSGGGSISETRNCSVDYFLQKQRFKFFLKDGNTETELIDSGLIEYRFTSFLNDSAILPVSFSTESRYLNNNSLVDTEYITFSFTESGSSLPKPSSVGGNVPAFYTSESMNYTHREDLLSFLIGKPVIYATENYTYKGTIQNATLQETNDYKNPNPLIVFNRGVYVSSDQTSGNKKVVIDYVFTERLSQKRALQNVFYTPDYFTFYLYEQFENNLEIAKHFRLYKNSSNGATVLVYSRFLFGNPFTDSNSYITGNETSTLADIFTLVGNKFVYTKTISGQITPLDFGEEFSVKDSFNGINIFPF